MKFVSPGFPELSVQVVPEKKFVREDGGNLFVIRTEPAQFIQFHDGVYETSDKNIIAILKKPELADVVQLVPPKRKPKKKEKK